MSNFIPRNLSETAIAEYGVDGIDCYMIVQEMRNIYEETYLGSKVNQERHETFERITEELCIPEFSVMDKGQSFETARRIALVVDAMNMLAHIYAELTTNARGEQQKVFAQKQESLWYQKDEFMRLLGTYCKRRGICAGIGVDGFGQDTFEVDIPYVGHVGWHFGGKAAKYDQMRGEGIDYYPHTVEAKRYSNAALLLGDLNPKEMTVTDSNLVDHGSIFSAVKRSTPVEF